MRNELCNRQLKFYGRIKSIYTIDETNKYCMRDDDDDDGKSCLPPSASTSILFGFRACRRN